jgi:PAS domain S-box-containing protein
MTREKYIEQHILELLQSWTGVATLIGSFIILALGVLDYFVTPENFKTFFVYRSLAAGGVLACFVLNKTKTGKNWYHFITIAASIIVSSMVAVMIAKFGGHESPYFAGIILALVFVVGLAPLNLLMCVIASFTIYAIYLMPILVYDTITNKAFFLVANIFIILIMTATVLLRYLIHQRFLSEFGLQYDLEQQKKQLEVYSLQLKGMVEERTKELHESEQWHRSLLENATDGIIVLDRNGIILNANDTACKMHGFPRESLIGTHIKLLEDESNKKKTAETMRRILEGESLVFETKHNKKDGTQINLEVSSKAITIGDELLIQSFYRDITEKKRLHEHLFQSQKMESIGVLAGGIAHDFNNVLTAILGHAGIIRKSTSLDERSTRSLGVIEDASRRAGRMISKLLGFARKSKFELAPLNLNDVVYDTVKLLEQVIDKRINLSVELDNRLPMIQGDVNQMEQIIMNFVVNARDAMPNGGRIVIRTRPRTVIKGLTDVPLYVPPGEYVELSVSDTGTGIPEDIVNKIFEPFFTTKEQGKGTGLGLSMVYGAVREHRGYLSVQSTPGSGSQFIVYFPASCAGVQTGAPALAAPSKGRETILVVDDEEEILESMRESLESQGYKVFATSDSTVALDVYKKIHPETSLIITDIVMPRMDGKELIGEIKRMTPKVKILALSGYTKYIAEMEEIKDIDGFLQKPFESYYLLSVVRRILDTRSKNIIPA